MGTIALSGASCMSQPKKMVQVTLITQGPKGQSSLSLTLPAVRGLKSRWPDLTQILNIKGLPLNTGGSQSHHSATSYSVDYALGYAKFLRAGQI